MGDFALNAFCRTGRLIEAKTILQAKDCRPGSTWTVRGNTQFDDGTSLDVAFKAANGKQLANELVAAWLGRSLGWASVAEAIVVDDFDGLVGKLVGEQYPQDRFARGLGSPFSSLSALSVPSYDQRVELTRTADFQRLIVFDALIANTDRVDRNVLGNETLFVFDHDKAFTGEGWTEASLRFAYAIVPHGPFEQYLAFADAEVVECVCDTAQEWQERLLSVDLAELKVLVELELLEAAEVRAMQDFISRRAGDLPALAKQVLNRNP
jgi:hypothetical protein